MQYDTISPSSTSLRSDTGSAAEFVATVRKDHVVMMQWYQNCIHSNTITKENKEILQELHNKYGPKYPMSWKIVLNWSGWKETRDAYLQYVQSQSQSQQQQPSNNNTSTTSDTITMSESVENNSNNISASTSKEESRIDSSGTTNMEKKGTTSNEETSKGETKAKRKSRWGSAPTASTVSLPVAAAAPAASNEVDDSYNQAKRQRWGITTATGTETTNHMLSTATSNGNTNTTELDELRTQLRALNYKIDHVIEEATRIDKLPHGHRERSISPPPIYGPDGKRQNTRAVRYKEKYTTQRQDLLEKILDMTNQQQQQNNGAATSFGTSSGPYAQSTSMTSTGAGPLAGLLQYVKPQKKSEKIHIPVEKYPNYNFIGLIIGPRGKTQKELEAKTGCKIAIRGKGSVKEGARGRRDGVIDTGDYEPLHVVVTGDDPRAVAAAATMIREMLVVIDDEKNVHKQQQLRELALLNGTLKDDNDGSSNAALYCPICAEKGHRAFECPKRFNTNQPPTFAVKCAICGDTSHPTRDCKLTKSTGDKSTMPTQPNDNTMDSEYQSFMAELDGKTVAPPPPPAAAGVEGATSSLSLPPPPVGTMIAPPVLPPPPTFVPASTSNIVDGQVSTLSLPPPPPPIVGIQQPPTTVPQATVASGVVSSSLPPPPLPMYGNLPPHPPMPTIGVVPQQQYHYPQPPTGMGLPVPPQQPTVYPYQQQHQYSYPPPPMQQQQQQQALPTAVQPGQETATWDPNAYYGANNDGGNATNLNWWEQ